VRRLNGAGRSWTPGLSFAAGNQSRWSRTLRFIIEPMMHVLNGDATRKQLERSGVRGTLTVWADALHDGPVPAGLSRRSIWRTLHSAWP
jgi:hypothetical protein